MIAGRFTNEEYGAPSNGSARPPFVANAGSRRLGLANSFAIPSMTAWCRSNLKRCPQRSTGDLQARMPSEGLHPLGRKPGLDPARDREMREPVPIGYLERLVPAMLYHLFSSTTNTLLRCHGTRSSGSAYCAIVTRNGSSS